MTILITNVITHPTTILNLTANRRPVRPYLRPNPPFRGCGRAC